VSLTKILIPLLFFATALLYASVGNASPTSYLAVMALFGFPPEEMKSTALLLNILVAIIAAYKFYRAGCFSWQLFWPFALTSIPLLFWGAGFCSPKRFLNRSSACCCSTQLSVLSGCNQKMEILNQSALPRSGQPSVQAQRWDNYPGWLA
jgi:uncharacterized membrane protein YfcA